MVQVKFGDRSKDLEATFHWVYDSLSPEILMVKMDEWEEVAAEQRDYEVEINTSVWVMNFTEM